MSTAPPPFKSSEGQKRSSSKTFLIVFAVIGIPCCGLLGVGAYFFWNTFKALKRDLVPAMQCGVAFEDIRDAIVMYAHDHGDKLPDAKTWQDDVRPYYLKTRDRKFSQKENPFKFTRIPAEGLWGCRKDETSQTGIAYNSAFSGKKLDDVKDQYETVVLFEIEAPRSNAAEPLRELPKSGAPRIFGHSRNWMRIPLKGKSNFRRDGGGFNDLGDD